MASSAGHHKGPGAPQRAQPPAAAAAASAQFDAVLTAVAAAETVVDGQGYEVLPDAVDPLVVAEIDALIDEEIDECIDVLIDQELDELIDQEIDELRK